MRPPSKPVRFPAWKTYVAADEEECPLKIVDLRLLVAKGRPEIDGGYIWARVMQTKNLVFYAGSKREPSSRLVGLNKAMVKWVPFLDDMELGIHFTKKIVKEIWMQFVSHLDEEEDSDDKDGEETQVKEEAADGELGNEVTENDKKGVAAEDGEDEGTMVEMAERGNDAGPPARTEESNAESSGSIKQHLNTAEHVATPVGSASDSGKALMMEKGDDEKKDDNGIKETGDDNKEKAVESKGANPTSQKSSGRAFGSLPPRTWKLGELPGQHLKRPLPTESNGNPDGSADCKRYRPSTPPPVDLDMFNDWI